MTNLIDISKLIEAGEGEMLEYKASFNIEVIESLVAFANTLGGKVVVGINNKNEIIGVKVNEESVQNWVNEIKGKTAPPIIPNVNVVQFKDKAIVIFTIQEYPIKPVSTRGKYFKRVLNSNHQMSLTEVANEHLRIINSSWDYYPDPNHSLENISLDKVEKYTKEYEKWNDKQIDYTPLEFLNKQEILRNDELTFGAYLLFAKDVCIVSDVQIGRFKSPTKIIDSLIISLNIEINSLQKLLKRLVKWNAMARE